MEGFWTINFTGIEGFGAGVVTLLGGGVYGGDSGFLYMGTYTQSGDNFTGRVHVKAHAETGRGNVMGSNEFDLNLNGTIKGSSGSLTAVIPGTGFQLSATLRKQSDIQVK